MTQRFLVAKMEVLSMPGLQENTGFDFLLKEQKG